MRHPDICISHSGEAQSPLVGVEVQGAINEVFTLVTVTQAYKNREKTNIEAVYTFPMPVDATLLRLQAKIGEITLEGVVSRKEEAEERYEAAVAGGDSAILLENPSSGLYSMNLGNLMPGEEASITFQYASLNAWSGESLRFFLPTTIAPHYGDSLGAGLQGHQTPEFSTAQENRMRIFLRLVGNVRDSGVSSPSHRVVIERSESATTVNVLDLSAGSVVMDRDFVLNVKAPHPVASYAYFENDGEDAVAVAAFKPSFPTGHSDSPRCVSVVVDCSGSMCGDSIAQACKALQAIITALRPQDHFNIVLFGSGCRKLFEDPVSATQVNLRTAGRLAANLEANLGGTEIEKALMTTLGTQGPEGVPHDILLVTDGEVWDDGSLVKRLIESGRRVFTVGVGSAVSEAFLRELANATGGACELVTPGEGMSECIVAQFKRIFADIGTGARVAWPSEPSEAFPRQIRRVFEGDTLHVFARLSPRVTGEVGLAIDVGGETVTASVQLVPLPAEEGLSKPSQAVLSRLMAAAIVREFGTTREVGEDLAVRYNLMSPWTNFVLVMEREAGEKTKDLPELRKVRQTLAAGWHGMGSVVSAPRAECIVASSPSYLRARKSERSPGLSVVDCISFDDGEFVSVSPMDRFSAASTSEDSLEAFIDRFNREYASNRATIPCRELRDLERFGVPQEVLRFLAGELDRLGEEAVVVAFLLTLLSFETSRRIDRQAARLVCRRAETWSEIGDLADEIERFLRSRP